MRDPDDEPESDDAGSTHDKAGAGSTPGHEAGPTTVEPNGAEAAGVESGDAEPGGVESGDAEPASVEAGAAEPASAKPSCAEPASAKPVTVPARDPLWARLLVVAGVVLVLLAGATLTASRFLTHRYDAAIDKAALLAPEARTTALPQQRRRAALRGPLNYLLLGSDARVGNAALGQRSDTIIILHVPASLDRAYLVSVPRDLRVRIPPFPETGFRGASHMKINSAFEVAGGGLGGVALVSQTLTDLLGIRFDGAAIIDFSGFRTAVDLLGGVNICVDVRTESHHIGHDKDGNFLAPWGGPEGEHRNYDSTPVVYEPGCQHMEAWQALDFARQRKSLPDGDFGRQRHQQQLLRTIFDEARAQHLTTNPILLDRFIRAIGGSLTVDTNGVPIEDVVFGLRDIQPSNLLGLQVPSDPDMIGGISYIVARPEADTLYRALREDALDIWALENASWVNRI